MKRFGIPMIVLASMFAIANVHADDIRKLSTEPVRSAGASAEHGPARMDFNFGSLRGWLLADGNWHIEGTVQHHGALCASYRVGIQFGTGGPGCANVNWIGEPSYGTYERQCNNALVRHYGGGQDPKAAQHFDEITCAQRVILCSGNCK